MSGLFGISVEKDKEESINGDFFWGTFYQQHLGEEYSGISILNRSGEFIDCVHKGHFRTAFSRDEKIWKNNPLEAIGYCGPAPEPLYTDSKQGEFSLCFSGNIINIAELKQHFKERGQSFVRGDEAELLSKFIAGESNFCAGLYRIMNEVKGSFSVLLLTKEGIYAFSDGRWPLLLGKKNGKIVVATSTAGFANLEIESTENIGGKMLLLKNGGVEQEYNISESPICSFMWVYTAFPADIIEGVPASTVRKKLGSVLARKDIFMGFTPDLVIPVPDSGRFHAIGYHQEFIRQASNGKISKIPEYDEVLLKYPYAGRSFTPQNQEIRELEALIKLIRSGEMYKGKTAVVVDDSIVRGTQARSNLVPKLRSLQLKEVHMRVGNPELISYCPWGKTTKQGELIANIMNMHERREYLDLDSLIYNSVNDLLDCLRESGIEKEVCMDCSRK